MWPTSLGTLVPSPAYPSRRTGEHALLRSLNFSWFKQLLPSCAANDNSYYLATAAEDGVVKLWDLRKLKNFRTINPSSQQEGPYEVREDDLSIVIGVLGLGGSCVDFLRFAVKNVMTRGSIA